MPRPACRVVRDDRRHVSSLTELITKPSAKLGIVDLLDSEPDGGAKNLLDAFLGCARRDRAGRL
jgi:hypothetical protein